MQIIEGDTGRLPVKVWTDYAAIEEGAKTQIAYLACLPFAFRHIAIMPDVHVGYGMPIGGVLATNGVVIPNAVGVDIGCGMRMMRTDLHTISLDGVKAIMGHMRKMIPVGFAHHQTDQPCGFDEVVNGPISEREAKAARRQVGTLGGGNHFIEIQQGDDGYVYVMIHSGSRNVGLQVANYYRELARSLNDRWHVQLPKAADLAFLPLDAEEGEIYCREMGACLEFAKMNRALMMSRVREAFVEAYAGHVAFEPDLDVHHNYAAMENHFGHNVMVHRKGATQARDGQLGIIPGSQGTPSYIVIGLGNRESFYSCSHGAGRRMGRKQAQERLDLSAEIARLESQHIVHAVRTKADLEEAAGAYKDIDEVMANQTDLVVPVVKLRPLGVIKDQGGRRR